MDNVTLQIAQLVDELSSRGLMHISFKGFCGLEELELSVEPKKAPYTMSEPFPEDERENYDDIQYAASGVVPMNIKEMYK